MLDEFFQSDDPAMSFRHVRKAYDELKKATNGLRSGLIEQAVATYEEIFNELDQKAAEYGVTEKMVYGDREHNLNRIKALKSITSIRYELSNAPAFKSGQLTQIIDFASRRKPVDGQNHTLKVGEPKEFYLSKLANVIRNEQELDEYLARARKEMLALLKDQKTIIIK
ncbi:MAG: hypothetical protein F9K10_04310 [Paludibacter sp.]|nr:MAG: hypothetical protein F9K10_04310 [Paludibacter sp.]